MRKVNENTIYTLSVFFKIRPDEAKVAVFENRKRRKPSFAARQGRILKKTLRQREKEMLLLTKNGKML